jgi:putative sigma-54 modulation protein
MRTSIAARSFRASTRLQDYANNEVKRLKKYFDNIIDCDIILSYQRENKTCEILLSVGGTVLKATEHTDDFYKSINKTVDKLEQQVKRYKAKLRKH